MLRPTLPKVCNTDSAAILLTGFDAFGGDAVNPSWIVAKSLHGRRIAGHTIVAAQLPTVFGASLRVLDRLLIDYRPVLVVCLGLAGGRAAMSIERIAVNIEDARIPDNAGAQPVDTPVRKNGPAAYFTNLPIKAMLQALRKSGVAAEVSQSAGTFVCNHVFYGLMHALSRRPRHKGVRGGFIHLPWLPEQGVPSMPLAQMQSALCIALRSAMNSKRDVPIAAGSTH